MKRDMDCIRALLLKLECLDLPPGATMIFEPHREEFAIEGKTGDKIEYHFELLMEAALLYRRKDVMTCYRLDLAARPASRAGASAGLKNELTSQFIFESV